MAGLTLVTNSFHCVSRAILTAERSAGSEDNDGRIRIFELDFVVCGAEMS